MTQPAAFYRDPSISVRFRAETCGGCKFDARGVCEAGISTYTGCEMREPDKNQKKGAGQKKRHSLLESILNVAIGFGIALLTQVLVFPLFGWHPSIGDNLAIGSIFTIVSIVRSYYVRRLFNLLHVRGIL